MYPSDSPLSLSLLTSENFSSRSLFLFSRSCRIDFCCSYILTACSARCRSFNSFISSVVIFLDTLMTSVSVRFLISVPSVTPNFERDEKIVYWINNGIFKANSQFLCELFPFINQVQYYLFYEWKIEKERGRKRDRQRQRKKQRERERENKIARERARETQRESNLSCGGPPLLPPEREVSPSPVPVFSSGPHYPQ